ncbi:MAG TPA: hypothetical protein VEP89_06480 [Draconibacterium sp.]|nr:hypothetical protein [Draconibacterium sp.]
MFKSIFILLLIVPFLSVAQINQTDANGLRQGLWQKKQDNGRLSYEGKFKDDRPVGEWKRYHPGGQVKAIIEYKGDTAFTQLFDVWRKKVAEGNYVNERKEGVWKIFNNNRLVADEEFKLGIKHGKSHRYYDTGEVMEEKQWVNNKEEGNYQIFYKSGQPYVQCKMKLGMRNGLFLSNYRNGRTELEAEYRNNLRHGEWKYFDEEGNQLYSLFYDNGQILNPHVRDSIDNLKMMEIEKNKGTIPDPEEFLQDPSEYMMRDRMQR